MQIGIIGAGQIGGTLTRLYTGLGHQVRVANSRDPQTLAELAAETGATAVWAREAALGAEVVVVSIPQKNVPALAATLGTDWLSAAAPGAPVIETNNYYPQQRDGAIPAIESGTPESVWVAQQLGLDPAGGEHPLYKIFNGIFWKHLLEYGRPAGSADRIALPVAGPDVPARKTVFELVDTIGFDPVDAGPLAQSWRQQPATPSYGTDLPAAKLVEALAAATPERTAEFRA